MIDRETMMASTPVIRRLGIMVIAGSPAKKKTRKRQGDVSLVIY